MLITECDEHIAQWLEEKLLVSLKDTNEQAENTSIILTAKESDEQIVGGLAASTSYGWLLIKILWVDRNCRGSGIGSSLMQHAEMSALSRGCHGAWLDTSSPDAHKFYVNLGYEAFGELQNSNEQSPLGHRRWFMKKILHSEM